MFINETEICMKFENINFYYGKSQALKNVNLIVPQNRVTAIIGPSGCGKSTFIRMINRMNELIPGARFDGRIFLNGKDIYNCKIDVAEVRRIVGMVFQKPNPFPKTIFENISYGLKINGIRDKAFIADRVENALKRAALWDEVKNRLNDNALGLSGGQQQRLCIARCLAVEPEVILFDEPCASLDPISTAKIEELILDLKKNYTIIIVTHNMQQAARVSDFTAFFYLGKLIEYNLTNIIFTKPSDRITEDYITGRFG